MREFTKSMISYTWATSVFGFQQMINLLAPQRPGQRHVATESFNSVAQGTTQHLGDAMRATYRVGDNLQRGTVDAMFGVMTLGALDRGSSSAGGGVGNQTSDAFQQGMRAVGQVADVIGQAVGGVTSGWGGCGGARPPSEPTGWGPVRPPQDP